uniref:Uncharacterized protein n=1 Tax=Rhizophora mucronata TaxID=61149 RepID=A0A2P2N8C3_RHIMU
MLCSSCVLASCSSVSGPVDSFVFCL